jgi:hypothetical protein
MDTKVLTRLDAAASESGDNRTISERRASGAKYISLFILVWLSRGI